MSTSKPLTSPVSDEELMLLVDDELADERRAEVEQVLASDPEARAKLAGLEWVGEVLRERAEDERADGIADAVMARLAPEQGEAPTDQASADEQPGEVVPLRASRQQAPRPLDRPAAANDNARGIFALAAAAAAVAAGLYFWSRSGADDMSLEARRRAIPPNAIAAAEGESSGASAQPRWLREAPEQDPPAEEPSAAVEVASVDFGSHTGSVFYVSTGPDDAATTTAVVWVTDDVTGDAP